MPPRAVDGEQEQWDRVAQAIYDRRTELGSLTHRQVIERSDGSVSISLLSLIENARQTSYQAGKLRALSRALSWTSDSIERILAGDEPQPGPTGVAGDTSIEDRLARLEAELAALRAQLEAERATRSEPA